MELDNTQAVTSEIPTQRVGQQAQVPSGAHQEAVPVGDGSVEEQLHRLERQGWKVLRDVVKPFEDADPVSAVMVGSQGIIVLETAPRFLATNKDSFLTAAGSVAATLPAEYRNRVASVLVLLGDPQDALAACSAPPAIDIVPASNLTLWLMGTGIRRLTDSQVDDVAAILTKAWSSRAAVLLTADNLPPESECIPEASLRARRAPAERVRWMVRGKNAPARKNATERERRGPKPERTGERADFSLTDMIRIALVTFSVVVGLWFASVMSDMAGSSAGETATKSPVTSTQPSGIDQAGVPSPDGVTRGGLPPGSR